MSRGRIVIFVVAAVALILGAITSFVLMNGDKFKTFAVESVNDKLSTKLSVSEVGLSVWAEFPMVTVDLRDVVLMGSVSHASAKADTLIRAKNLGVALSLWDILFGEPKIDAIVLEGAKVRVRELKNGTWNTSILASETASETGGTESSSTMSISKITLRDVSTVIIKRSGESYHGVISHGVFQDGDINVSFSQFREEDGESLNKIHPLGGYADASFTTDENHNVTLSIDDAVINDVHFTGSSSFNINWDYDNIDEGDNTWEVNVSAKQVGVKMIRSIFISDEYFKGWDYDGSADLAIQITQKKAHVVWSISEDNFSIAPELTGLNVRKSGGITARGNLDYFFENSVVALSVEALNLNSNGLRLSTSISCANIQKKPLYFNGEVIIDASSSYSSWLPAFQNGVIKIMPNSGELVLTGGLQVSPSGEISHIETTFYSEKLDGDLDAAPYSIRNLAGSYKRDNLKINRLQFDWSGNKGELDASINSIRKTIKGGGLNGSIQIRCESVVLGSVLSVWNNEGDDDESRDLAEKAVLLPNGSDLDLQLSADRMFWDELALKAFNTSLKVSSSRLQIINLKAEGLQGTARVEGSLRPGGPGWVLGLFGSLDDISLPDLFLTFNNFGQSSLRSEHLSGAGSAAGTIHLGWDLSGNFIPDAFTTNLEVSIDNGRLKGVEVFDDVADYLKAHRLIAPLVDPEDLRKRLSDIEFNHLVSPISIASSKTTIPNLNIHSSAMDVSVEGVHSFNGDIDYTLGFALRDLRDLREVEFGSIEDDGLGNMFFLAMDGTLENPEYGYDREAHKSHRRKGLNEEAQRIKDAIQSSGNSGNSKDTKKEKSAKKKKTKSLDELDDEDF
ncbi:MAG: hypothetical protein COA49_03795 [Bacteroidetes bacterium]|nr:MAG: hypothetical protein COA49_03795 [Bacteroidota bacterium]